MLLITSRGFVSFSPEVPVQEPHRYRRVSVLQEVPWCWFSRLSPTRFPIWSHPNETWSRPHQFQALLHFSTVSENSSTYLVAIAASHHLFTPPSTLPPPSVLLSKSHCSCLLPRSPKRIPCPSPLSVSIYFWRYSEISWLVISDYLRNLCKLAFE